MHPQATTALTLGIIGLAGTFTCVLPIFVGPFAWWIGAKVKREIAARPGQYRGESEGNVGMILGIVTTALLVLAILATIAVIVLVAVADPSPDYSSDYSTDYYNS
jgi:heme/copper-type cytochrome/quinol oxidase subunit 2